MKRNYKKIIKIVMFLFIDIFFLATAYFLIYVKGITAGSAFLILPCILCALWFSLPWSILNVLLISIIIGFNDFYSGLDSYLSRGIIRVVIFLSIIIFISLFNDFRRKSIKNQQILDNMTNSATDAIVGVDTDGEITSLNMAAEKLFGYRLKNSPGLKMNDLIMPGESREQFIRVFKALKESEDGYVFGKPVEMEGLTRNGNTIPIEFSLISSQMQKEWIVYIVIRDLSERKKLEHEINELNLLIDKNARLMAINNLASGIAHDFNNIIAGIKGQLNIVENRCIGNDSVSKHIENIKKLSDRAISITEELLRSFGSFDINRQKIRVADLINDIASTYKTQFPDRMISLENLVGSEIINADFSLIEEAVTEVLNNSFEALSESEMQVVNINVGIVKKLRLGQIDKEDFVCIEVSDKGRGIGSESLLRVYEPFFTTKELGTSAGIGLTKTYGIISQHEGFIDIESRQGLGTDVSIFLPLS